MIYVIIFHIICNIYYIYILYVYYIKYDTDYIEEIGMAASTLEEIGMATTTVEDMRMASFLKRDGDGHLHLFFNISYICERIRKPLQPNR